MLETWTHLVSAFGVAIGLSELESMSIDNGVGARDKLRREESCLFKDLAILPMGLFLDGLSLDMMITVKRTRFNGLPTVIDNAVESCMSLSRSFT